MFPISYRTCSCRKVASRFLRRSSSSSSSPSSRVVCLLKVFHSASSAWVLGPSSYRHYTTKPPQIPHKRSSTQALTGYWLRRAMNTGCGEGEELCTNLRENTFTFTAIGAAATSGGEMGKATSTKSGKIKYNLYRFSRHTSTRMLPILLGLRLS